MKTKKHLKKNHLNKRLAASLLISAAIASIEAKPTQGSPYHNEVSKYSYADSKDVSSAFNNGFQLSQASSEEQYLNAFFEHFRYADAEIVSDCLEIEVYDAKLKIGSFIVEDSLDAAGAIIANCKTQQTGNSSTFISEDDMWRAFFDIAGYSYENAEVVANCFNINTDQAKLKIGGIAIQQGVTAARELYESCEQQVSQTGNGYTENQLINAYWNSGINYDETELVSRCFNIDYYDAKLKLGYLKLDSGSRQAQALVEQCRAEVPAEVNADEALLNAYWNSNIEWTETEAFADCFGVDLYDMKLKIGQRKLDYGDAYEYFSNSCSTR